MDIYNSRNYSILLNQTAFGFQYVIYNSRNYSILLNSMVSQSSGLIYNSRNYSILLNIGDEPNSTKSTTVEIILYYLTQALSVLRFDLQQ